MKPSFLFITVGALLLAPTPGVAAPGDAIALPPPAADPFSQVIAARSVAEFARRQRDPQAMIVAARMLQEVPFEDKASDKGLSEASPPAFSPTGLFAEAKTLAKNDASLLMQINIAQSTSSRGVVSSAFGKGLLRMVQDVAARTTYRFALRATGGQLLRVGAIGDVGTAILLRIVDAAGRVVCTDNPGNYAPVCSTTPAVAGNYQVEVINRSGVKSRAVILSN